jgi:hypothetical protein
VKEPTESERIWKAIGELQNTVLEQGNMMMQLLERRLRGRDGAIGGLATLILTILATMAAKYFGVQP